MSDKTPHNLAQAFRHLATIKNVDNITIQEICDEAHRSRMTFYYHFKDIEGLMDWTFNETAQTIIGKHKDQASWMEAIDELVQYVYNEKPFMMNVCHSVSYDAMQRCLNDIIGSIVKEVCTEEQLDTLINTQEYKFLMTLFTHGLTGVCIDWVKEGLKEDPKVIVKELNLALDDFLKGSVIILNKNNE